MSADAGDFFDGYAADFNSIYGGEERGAAGRWVDKTFRKSMLLRYERTLERCTPIEGASVLDIGCGPGHYSVALASRGAGRVLSIDPAAEMLRISQKRAEDAGVMERCEFKDVLLEDLKTDEKFDFSVVMGVMDYVEDAGPFILKVMQFTKKRAVFSFPAAGGILAIQRSIRYRNRTALYLYKKEVLEQTLQQVAGSRATIHTLARDFFVEIDCSS